MSRCYCEQCQKWTLWDLPLVSWVLSLWFDNCLSLVTSVYPTSLFFPSRKRWFMEQVLFNCSCSSVCQLQGALKLPSALPTVIYSNDLVCVWMWFMQTARGAIYKIYVWINVWMQILIRALSGHRRRQLKLRDNGTDLNDLSLSEGTSRLSEMERMLHHG